MGSTRPFLFVLLFSLILGAWQIHPLQTQTDGKYFGETGHWVTGEFWEAYRSVPNPELLYGNPITDAFQDSTTSNAIQYFEKARFELHHERPAGQRILISPLGEYLYEPGTLLPLPPAAACRSFAETGYQVCYSFLEFFDANGGLQQFGNPISNLELHNDRMVQYFQRARFEWRPDLKRVTLSPLGRQYFDMRGENPVLLLPPKDNVLGRPEKDQELGVIRLRARAYPAKAVTGRQGEQTVHIIVQDQRLLAAPDTRVKVEVRLPSGEIQRYDDLPLTDENGLTQVEFTFDSSRIGTAEIYVTAERGAGQFTRTVTSFRLWW